MLRIKTIFLACQYFHHKIVFKFFEKINNNLFIKRLFSISIFIILVNPTIALYWARDTLLDLSRVSELYRCKESSRDGLDK